MPGPWSHRVQHMWDHDVVGNLQYQFLKLQSHLLCHHYSSCFSYKITKVGVVHGSRFSNLNFEFKPYQGQERALSQDEWAPPKNYLLPKGRTYILQVGEDFFLKYFCLCKRKLWSLFPKKTNIPTKRRYGIGDHENHNIVRIHQENHIGYIPSLHKRSQCMLLHFIYFLAIQTYTLFKPQLLLTFVQVLFRLPLESGTRDKDLTQKFSKKILHIHVPFSSKSIIHLLSHFQILKSSIYSSHLFYEKQHSFM